ncbi:cytochrome c oxidase assembly factor CtaG [Bacillus aquiflavi]|uniref:Cytochrome c oxidase assembly factor CtaG n=1 Tax=Bacillus aquiflavi TaxID=2672567 RepID=A0A6B3W0S4_9BACI|nr:cytochrome c oxidase assembly factor CtaG [Bacillus aquiflavi]MBA4537939.1 cytochrome c oxidase assembly factor CtaG [Bacillus aquiflavi]NEY82195.1 cytochrome c oxidase assembly factor CtaG [Bacillus aquiflavi]UAC49268.1 cytochrome c oxidase assembly factor CtaG [Bacillus aquiflavi]
MLTLDIFGFRALWSPYFLIALILILVGYFLITVKFRTRFASSEPLTKKQAIFFSVGIALLYTIKGSPIDLLGHITFYTHMIQMAFLYLIIPPIIIVGIPQWIWRAIINAPVIKHIFKFFTKPIIALILFNGFFSLYHIPLVFDVIKTDFFLHALYTGFLFIMSGFMWWPLINQLPEQQTLSGLKKVGYIFADGVLLTPACALIIFNEVPMYVTFSDPQAWAQALELCVPASTLAGLTLSGPEMFTTMSLLEDQRLGGVLMKVIQEVVYGTILAKVFFAWYQEEQEQALEVEMEVKMKMKEAELNPQPVE